MVCPHCDALVDVSGYPRSPQVYCPHCGTVGTLVVPVPFPDEPYLGICEVCHYFGFPAQFTSHRMANLFFLLRWEWETATMCGACMGSEAWIDLRGNVISVIGIPFSVVEFMQVYLSGSRRHKRFAELDAANEAAANGRQQRAEILYERMLDRIGISAPLHYNRAKLRFECENWSGALEEAMAAHGDCSNLNLPLDLACRSLIRLERRDEAEALCARYRLKVDLKSSS